LRDTKLYKVLSSFSAIQLNRLHKYVLSPYFNVNDHLTVGFEIIKEAIKEDKNLEVKEIWDEIFKGIPYSDIKWRKFLSDIVSLIEGFLIQESLSKEELLKYNMLLQAIRREKLEELQKKTVTNANREMDRRLEQSGDFFYQKYLILKNQYNLTSQFERKRVKLRKKQAPASEQLLEVSKQLDIFYLLEKMRHGTDLLTWRKMYKADIDLSQFEFTSKLIEKSQYLDIPAIKMYYNIYKAFVEPDEPKYYFDLKELFIAEMDQFPLDEQQEIFDSLVSYCIGSINSGNKDFIPEALEMYQKGIDTGLSLVDGELSPTTFRNIVGLALRYQYLNFAKEFIQEKASLVNKKFRNNAVNYNLARVHFYKKEFNEVLDYSNQVNFEDVWYNINTKALLLATYYELDEDNALESLLTSYNAYIRREKSLEEKRRMPYLNFIKSIRKMIKINPFDKEKIKALKKEIESTKAINKAWLLEKINEIQK